MKIKPKALIFAAAAFISTTANSESLLYGVLMQSLSDPFWQSMEHGLKEGTESVEVDYYLQTVDSNDAKRQLSACNAMLERKPNIMIISAVDPAVLLPCLRAANNQNTPVVDLGGTLNHHNIVNAQIEIAASITPNNEEAGAQAAEYLAQQLDMDTTGTVLLIEGASSTATRSSINGFTERLAKTASHLDIILSTPDNLDRYSAANVVNKALAQNTHDNHPAVNAVFAVNEDIALGATDAVFAADKGDEIIVIGIGASTSALHSIKASRLNASVAMFPYLIGRQAIEAASRVLDGKNVKSTTSAAPMVISRELLNDGTNQMLKYLQ